MRKLILVLAVSFSVGFFSCNGSPDTGHTTVRGGATLQYFVFTVFSHDMSYVNNAWTSAGSMDSSNYIVTQSNILPKYTASGWNGITIQYTYDTNGVIGWTTFPVTFENVTATGVTFRADQTILNNVIAGHGYIRVTGHFTLTDNTTLSTAVNLLNGF